jgi:H/ACA ribonucleoprotein complex subunit 3
MRHILVCKACRIYTLKDECKECGGKTDTPKPPKYSPEDKYARYRRKVLEKDRAQEGLI